MPSLVVGGIRYRLVTSSQRRTFNSNLSDLLYSVRGLYENLPILNPYVHLVDSTGAVRREGGQGSGPPPIGPRFRLFNIPRGGGVLKLPPPFFWRVHLSLEPPFQKFSIRPYCRPTTSFKPSYYDRPRYIHRRHINYHPEPTILCTKHQRMNTETAPDFMLLSEKTRMESPGNEG